MSFMNGKKYTGPPSSSFPMKLMAILSNHHFAETISWLPHGRAFSIYKKKRFEAEVLPLYFPKQTKYSSFTRRLSRWGFKRVKSGPNIGVYYHGLFRKEDYGLCLQMHCINSSKIPPEDHTTDAADVYISEDGEINIISRLDHGRVGEKEQKGDPLRAPGSFPSIQRQKEQVIALSGGIPIPSIFKSPTAHSSIESSDPKQGIPPFPPLINGSISSSPRTSNIITPTQQTVTFLDDFDLERTTAHFFPQRKLASTGYSSASVIPTQNTSLTITVAPTTFATQSPWNNPIPTIIGTNYGRASSSNDPIRALLLQHSVAPIQTPGAHYINNVSASTSTNFPIDIARNSTGAFFTPRGAPILNMPPRDYSNQLLLQQGQRGIDATTLQSPANDDAITQAMLIPPARGAFMPKNLSSKPIKNKRTRSFHEEVSSFVPVGQKRLKLENIM